MVCWIIPIYTKYIYDAVLAKGRGAIIVKKDIKDAFRIIPVAPYQRWLLGFQWENRYYQEEVLSFGLRTAPFLFNLVAEAFQWILEAWLGWELFHYLDDFIRVVPTATSISYALTTLIFTSSPTFLVFLRTLIKRYKVPQLQYLESRSIQLRLKYACPLKS